MAFEPFTWVWSKTKPKMGRCFTVKQCSTLIVSYNGPRGSRKSPSDDGPLVAYLKKVSGLRPCSWHSDNVWDSDRVRHSDDVRGFAMSLRVLIVDDSVFVRDVLRHHLECLGCSVVAEAENTMQALELFRTVSPNVITLDVAVPQIGGLGALALFRIIRSENPTAAVLVISGLAFPEVKKSFLREGVL